MCAIVVALNTDLLSWLQKSRNSDSMTQPIPALPFDFTVPGEPLSLNNSNSRSRQLWRQNVRHSARFRWRGGPPFNQRVKVTIISFFNNNSAPFDVDNVPKRILDALKGLIIVDDHQITDLISLKRNRDENLQFTTLPPVMYTSLQNPDPFVYVGFEAAHHLEVP